MVVHFPRGVPVELRSRLIHKQQLWCGGDAAGKHQTLRFAAGQVAESAHGKGAKSKSGEKRKRMAVRRLATLASCDERQRHMVEGAAVGDAMRVLLHPVQSFATHAFDTSLQRCDPSGDDREQRGLA